MPPYRHHAALRRAAAADAAPLAAGVPGDQVYQLCGTLEDPGRDDRAGGASTAKTQSAAAGGSVPAARVRTDERTDRRTYTGDDVAIGRAC